MVVGDLVIINPRYREFWAIARVKEFNGSFVSTSNGVFHETDLEGVSEDSEWFDAQAEEELSNLE